ncbi:hypothetical protein BPNPMPFG_008385 (plasmid) [Mesorhizobium sp. AR07]|uniref:hypothetical protein n=1 Tax=Mesorhizobium sp. AR07 TaxID=2865838 RepID=UPI00215F9BA4|nr:hypothetical protein [Mesorhizobium sp. AR07]UVK49418.1 hypothetical protein BPNPMPFG_008385 [Mesorhizobium sp. AR07]
MKLPQRTELANDNGKPEDHLAAATVALHTAVQGLDASVEVLARRIGIEGQNQGRSRAEADRREGRFRGDQAEETLEPN